MTLATPSRPAGDDDLLRRYLLGELAEDERERLQAAYFDDDALFARLLAAEDDLIDAYARGTLTGARRRRFEQRFGQAPDHRRRLGFARALRHAVAPRPARAAGPPPSRPAGGRARWRLSQPWTAVAAAVLFAALLGGGWWAAHLADTPPLRRAAGPSPVPRPRHPAPAPPPETAAPGGSEATASPTPQAALPPGHPLPLVVASLVLRAGTTRSGGAPAEAVLGPETGALELRLELEPELRAGHARYEVVIQTATGADVFRQGGLEPQGAAAPSLVLRAPAASLTQRDYVVLLNAEQADGSRAYLRGYSFTVTRPD
jgi:hypothetical protein